MLRRSISALIVLLFCLSTQAFAQDPRVVPANDLFNSRTPLPRNSSGVIATIQEATAHESNEPVPTCAIDGNDTDSVWFRMDLPAGTLTFTAVGTGFVPVITLYQSEGPMTNLLPEMGCATNASATTSPVTTVLTAAVTADRYILRVAFDDLILPIADYPMDYTFTFVPPAGISIPSNDSAATAKPIVFNKIAKTNNVEYSTFDENDISQMCTGGPMYHSVWYTFSLEEDNVDVTLATEGSIYNEAQNNITPAKFMLFEETSPGILLQVACVSSGGHGGAANNTIQLDAGIYKVALFSLNAAGLDGPSLARLMVLVENLPTLNNPSFDTSLAPWKLKNATGDGIVTGPDSLDGSSFRFTGGPGEKSKLMQNVIPDNYIVPADSLLQLIYDFKLIALMDKNPTFEIRLTLSDGSIRSFTGKIFVPTNVGGFGNNLDQFVVTDRGTVKIQLIIKNKATAGTLVLDNLNIFLTPFGYGLRDGVLPAPPPAQ